MFGVVGVIVLIGGGIVGWLVISEQRRAEEFRKMRESVVLSASFDPVRCSPEFPIIVRFENKNTKTLLAVSFTLAGFRDGFSQPVYKGFTSESDKIIPPKEFYEACWSVPGSNGSNPPPPGSVTWRAVLSYPNPRFGTPP
jgi:hypothetical protein